MMDDYIPFGPEWEKEMMKLTKKHLIELLKKSCQEKIELKNKVDEFIYNEAHGETTHYPEER